MSHVGGSSCHRRRARGIGTVPLRPARDHRIVYQVSGSEAFNDIARKLHANPKVLEPIRTAARLALSPPSGNTASLGVPKPDTGVRPHAGSGCEVVSSTPSAGVIPSALALESKPPGIPPVCRPKKRVRRPHAQLRHAAGHTGIANRRSAVDMGSPTTPARSPLQLCRFSRDRSRCRR